MKTRNLSFVAVIAMILLGSCAKEKENALETIQMGSGENYVPNELLVKFRNSDGTATRSAASLLAMVGGGVIETIEILPGMEMNSRQKDDGGNLMLVKTKEDAMQAIARLKNMPEVEYAEPNFVYTHFATSNDPYYTSGYLWGMYGNSSSPSNTYGTEASTAWAAGKTGSSQVWVGIIDEGYMYNHTDLAANAGKNPGEIAGNGIDDDGNGYRDDVYGWDFSSNNNTVFDGVSDDHGTHVAGTIGAVGGNSNGVAGMVWKVKLMGAKFLGSSGGTTAGAIKAIDYFTDLKKRHKINIVATNNSWGGGGYSQGMYDAIERANRAGILFIVAAGNSANNNDVSASYPASYSNSNVIAVASITGTGALSSFSNYGASKVDLGAPGSDIYSTVPVLSGASVVSGYAGYSGTSMATPHVTGAVALYASTHSGASAATIKAAILNSVVATTSLSGKCVTGGRLNVKGF